MTKLIECTYLHLVALKEYSFNFRLKILSMLSENKTIFSEKYIHYE
jgi:hypothetical protein